MGSPSPKRLQRGPACICPSPFRTSRKSAVRYLSFPDRSKDLLQDPRRSTPPGHVTSWAVTRARSMPASANLSSRAQSLALRLPSIVLRSVYFDYEGLGRLGEGNPSGRLGSFSTLGIRNPKTLKIHLQA